MTLSERELEVCRVPHLGFVDLKWDPLLVLRLHEETRQDTVRGHLRSCLLPPRSPKAENRPLVALKGKAR